MTTTPRRPILDAELAQPAHAVAPNTRPADIQPSEISIARELPPWDLVRSDLLLVRRKAVKK